MEIRQLQYFAAIVREGSISGASRRLHVSQPALSKQMQALEQELGVELLTRVPQGVTATEAGRRLDEMAKHLLDYVDSIRPAVRGAVSTLRGVLNVGVSPSLMPELAGTLSAVLAAHHPELELRLTEGLPMFLSEWLDLGRLDVGFFTRWPADENTQRLTLIDLADDEVVLVAAPGHLPFEPDRTLDADVVSSLSLALTPGMHHLVATGLFGPDSEMELAGIEIDSVHTVKSLALRGEHCAALPFSFVWEDLDRGVLIGTPFVPPVRRQLVAATRMGRARSRAVEAVIEVARAHLIELASRGPRSASHNLNS